MLLPPYEVYIGNSDDVAESSCALCASSFLESSLANFCSMLLPQLAQSPDNAFHQRHAAHLQRCTKHQPPNRPLVSSTAAAVVPGLEFTCLQGFPVVPRPAETAHRQHWQNSVHRNFGEVASSPRTAKAAARARVPPYVCIEQSTIAFHNSGRFPTYNEQQLDAEAAVQ